MVALCGLQMEVEDTGSRERVALDKIRVALGDHGEERRGREDARTRGREDVRT